MQMAGSTRLSIGMCDTREYRKMAASNDWKNIRAPAKKKFPILQSKSPTLNKQVSQADRVWKSPSRTHKSNQFSAFPTSHD